MPKINLNGLDHYYEQIGEGAPLVFVHGAFADARLWEPQWDYFASKYRLLRYDLRGHGRTGASSLPRYSMETYADDLAALLDALQVRSPVLCGLSWGGSIVQALAARMPECPRAVILAGSMVAIDLTLLDKFLCRLLFPGWLMSFIINTLDVRQFTRFSFRLARLTLGKHLLGTDEKEWEYLSECMNRVERGEYLKIWQAMYAFRVFPLERITCPVLVLNGQHESGNTFRHTQEILRRIPHAWAQIVPSAHHGMNTEQPHAFNALLEDFLRSLDPHPGV